MTMRFNVADWYWIVGGDADRAWSSAGGAYVTEWDAQRTTRILNETELSDVLRPHGLAVPSPTQLDYADAIGRHLDAVAQSRGYRNADRLASYVASNNPSWSAEAAAFAAWRDDVWAYAYEQLAMVHGGQRAAPVVASFVTELPAISWPE